MDDYSPYPPYLLSLFCNFPESHLHSHTLFYGYTSHQYIRPLQAFPSRHRREEVLWSMGYVQNGLHYSQRPEGCGFYGVLQIHTHRHQEGRYRDGYSHLLTGHVFHWYRSPLPEYSLLHGFQRFLPEYPRRRLRDKCKDSVLPDSKGLLPEEQFLWKIYHLPGEFPRRWSYLMLCQNFERLVVLHFRQYTALWSRLSGLHFRQPQLFW